ncbi:DUF1161 domain-containing protein [Chromohalobacter sp. TMW 2.2308]|uniref:DUF1161 domain-containing protein n=1 Tax=Chromohalobacter moromii TaxID=2860329 RepID=A0A9X2X2P8_9GAMM|nr:MULTISPECIES: DUF1161 domain-containing protein [Chromohalobacter]MCK2043837.1 DUF1161 domain-containing protein [Chromohalobacter moromii]MCK2046478.1 DUF1161 domain-containing protein [Chromohalobacter moromii]MCT8505984.1 DUF1161 domain-containing protein [Chromohalobacter moromii]MCT8516038.1 DUF1161 domain-containing protein [Chromohalobacter sp. TMW 2.2271]
MMNHWWAKGLALGMMALPVIASAQETPQQDNDGDRGNTGVMACDALQDEIEAKIRANGVEDFQLDIIASERVDEDGVREGDDLAGGEVVGRCDGGTRKVIYRRGAQGSGAMSSEDAALPPRDGSSEPGEGGTQPAE